MLLSQYGRYVQRPAQGEAFDSGGIFFPSEPEHLPKRAPHLCMYRLVVAGIFFPVALQRQATALIAAQVILAATLLTNGLLIGAIFVLLLSIFTQQTDKHLAETYHEKAHALPVEQAPLTKH